MSHAHTIHTHSLSTTFCPTAVCQRANNPPLVHLRMSLVPAAVEIHHQRPMCARCLFTACMSTRTTWRGIRFGSFMRDSWGNFGGGAVTSLLSAVPLPSRERDMLRMQHTYGLHQKKGPRAWQPCSVASYEQSARVCHVGRLREPLPHRV